MAKPMSELIEAIKMEEDVLTEVQRIINCPDSYIGAEGRYGGCVKFKKALLRDYLISLNSGNLVMWHQNRDFPVWIESRFSLADTKCFDNLSVVFQRILGIERFRQSQRL